MNHLNLCSRHGCQLVAIKAGEKAAWNGWLYPARFFPQYHDIPSDRVYPRASKQCRRLLSIWSIMFCACSASQRSRGGGRVFFISSSSALPSRRYNLNNSPSHVLIMTLEAKCSTALSYKSKESPGSVWIAGWRIEEEKYTWSSNKNKSYKVEQGDLKTLWSGQCTEVKKYFIPFRPLISK